MSQRRLGHEADLSDGTIDVDGELTRLDRANSHRETAKHNIQRSRLDRDAIV